MDARLQTNSDNGIPDTWILLDSQSTVSIFRNAKFLRNIRNSPTKLVVDTNVGKQISTMIGDLKNFGLMCGTTLSPLQTSYCTQMLPNSIESPLTRPLNVLSTFTRTMERS